MDNSVAKNLIYFIWWNPDSIMLEYNLRFLKKYINVFDGQRIIKIAYDKYSPPKSVVRDLGAEIVSNDPVLNEAPHFKESLSRLNNNGITFYAHAKGVSRQVNKPLMLWVKIMYDYNLKTLPDLSQKLFSGCFGKLRPGSEQVPVDWHYSGSFYWFRNDEVLRRYNSQNIPKNIDNRWFTENFPGWIAKQEEVEFKVYASDEKGFNLYSEKFWMKNPKLLRL